MFALWPLGRYGAVLGQNDKSLKIGKKWLIVISISNPDESSYD
jgi:hypothetical protein